MGTVILGNELALDVNVICLLTLSLFFVSIVTAAAGRVIAVIARAGVLIFRLAKIRAAVRAVPEAAAKTEASEAAVAEAQAAAAEAVVAEAEAVIAAARLRLFGEAGS